MDELLSLVVQDGPSLRAGAGQKGSRRRSARKAAASCVGCGETYQTKYQGKKPLCPQCRPLKAEVARTIAALLLGDASYDRGGSLVEGSCDEDGVDAAAAAAASAAVAASGGDRRAAEGGGGADGAAAHLPAGSREATPSTVLAGEGAAGGEGTSEGYDDDEAAKELDEDASDEEDEENEDELGDDAEDDAEDVESDGEPRTSLLGFLPDQVTSMIVP